MFRGILSRSLLTLAFTLCFSVSYAQEKLFIKGKVLDSLTNEPVIGAVLKLASGGGAVSGAGGTFEIPVENAESIGVTISMIGYKQIVRKLAADGKEHLIILAEITNELGIVVITAGKFEQKIEELTVSVEVITPELIENKNINNMENIIDQCPGISMMEGQVNIRGGSGFSYGAGSRVLLLVDELPMLSADAGDVKWNFLPVENISQIEVIKGASSALFGSSALNGVINIRTAYPTETPRSSISYSSGVYGDPRRDVLNWWGEDNPTFTTVSFFHARQIKQLDLVLAGQVFNDLGFRQLEKEKRNRLNANLRYRSKKHPGLSYGVNFNRMSTEGGLFILWFSADSALRPSGGSVQQYLNYRTSIDPFLTYFSKKDSRHTLRGRYYQTVNTNDTQQESTADLYYGEYQYQKRFKSSFTLTSGLTGTYSEVRSDSMYGFHTSANISIFTQADYKWKRFTFSAGLRGEYFKVDTAETVFHIPLGKTNVLDLPVYPVARAGMNFKAAEFTYLRASYGQGYRFPSVAEKYVKTTVNSLTTFPNPGLQPEHGWSAELGVKQGIKIKKWKGYIDLAGFWTEYKDMMEFNLDYYFPEWLTNPTFFDYLDYFGAKSVNVGHTRITGFELTMTGTGTIGKDLEITLLGGYNYIHPVNLNNDSLYTSTFSDSGTNILKYRWEHVAKGDIQIDYKCFSFGISLRYNSFMKNIDRRFEDRLMYDFLPTYDLYILPGLKEYREEHNTGDLVFDARIGWEITNGSKLNFVVNNLFNLEYMSRPGDMLPPRNSAVQVVVKW